MKFDSLSLCEPLLRGLQTAGYEKATQIQQKAIPQIIEGRDLVGCAQTGTGKTAAFALPTLQQLMTPSTEPSGAAHKRNRTGRRAIRSLILAPTRELAAQIGDSLAKYGRYTGLRHAVIFGGVKQGAQVRALQSGVDILVATPGRLLDLIGQGFVKLGAVEILILDEADQMLDMGFIHDLRKIVAHTPAQRQTLMFSATMPKEVRELAGQWLRRPFELKVAPVASTPERVSQEVYFVERNRKAAVLTHILQNTCRSKTLVFSRTKRGADKIAKCLQRDGIRAVAIHGDKSQAKRQSLIREFNSKRPPVLVATDLASRGLDFSDVSHVINYDMPEAPETYVHRIGRTARAGASGQAVSFCGGDERHRLRMIEKLTGEAVAVRKLPVLPNNLPSRAVRPNTSQKNTVETGTCGPNKGDGDTVQGGGKKRPSKRRTGGNARPSREGSSGSSSGSRSGPKRRKFGKATRGKRNAQPRAAGSR